LLTPHQQKNQGGNVGNQSAIRVIRGLATGSLDPTWPCVRDTLAQQARVGVLLGGVLSAAGFVRVYVTNGDALNAAAISLSLLAIVLCSTVLGTSIPFALTRWGVDPAHGGTTIQVVMDCLGVLITCGICNVMLEQLASGLS
jgi:Mg/Co/Ni transporter MgtE